MVFDSLSKSLKSMASNTTDIAKKAVDTTSDFWEKALSPFEKMTKSVTKHIPWMWPESLREQAESTHTKEHIYTIIIKETKKFLTKTESLKLPVTKSNMLKTGMLDLLQQLALTKDEQSLYDMYIWAIKKWKEYIQESIPDSYTEDGWWSSSKKVSFTKKQLADLETVWSDFEQKIQTGIESWLKSSYDLPQDYITLDLSHSLKVYTDKEHDIINELIDKKYEVISETKKISYLVREIQRQEKKFETHKNTITKNKIQNIIEQKIPTHISAVQWLQKSILSLKEQWKNALTDLLTDQEKRSSDIQKQIETHTSIEKKDLEILTKKQWSAIQKLEKSNKKHHSTHVKLWDVLIKAPYDQHEKIQKNIVQEDQSHIDIQIDQKKVMSTLRSQHIHTHIYTLLQEKKCDLQIHINQDNTLIQKTKKLQLWLINRVHKKMVNVSKETLSQIQKVKKSDPSIKTLKSFITDLHESQQKKVESYETQKNTSAKTIQTLKEDIILHKKCKDYLEVLRDMTRSNTLWVMLHQKLEYIDTDIQETSQAIKTIW